ncbi:hypothetical protein [Sphingomicrobium flavum]|uniref:hypothetical protein n=1 Tax=Sphingomicrobium flavum TaxID=1229164 RepID=UPI0021AE1138|nr:hypothetical protein [Sphingomicrobium flavum]
MNKLILISAGLLMLPGCATTMSNPATLGTEANPVRVNMPQGERAYLDRLRCSDGSAPAYDRDGSVGPGRDGHILDLYTVTCQGAEPATSSVYMDMYHGDGEDRPLPNFTIVPAA